MAPPLQPVRGTRDILGDDAARHRHVVETARRVTSLYGFAEWQTPIFEDTRVFSRTLGETSDVVTKEMYTFEDRGGDSVTLRPEGTAGVCRALITAGLTQTLPQKVFYAGPMFRYERPQKGRYRQFHQIGVEVLGSSTPLADAEVIACGWQILNELGLAQDVELNLNTLGDAKSRATYRANLIEYFTIHENELSEESKIRLRKNPLRILDSKDEGDQKLVAGAPLMAQALSEDAHEFFTNVQDYLTLFKLPRPYLNPRIVRGLDYYNHTTFEFITTALGAQGTVLAGGRYDGLVEQMGGRAVPGVGWAAGIERLAMLLKVAPVQHPPVVIVFEAGEQLEPRAISVVDLFRKNGRKAEVALQPGLKNGLRYADRVKAKWAVVVTSHNMVGSRTELVRNLLDGSQLEIGLDKIVEHCS